MDDLIVTTIPCCITGSRQARIIAKTDRDGKPLRTVISTESGLVFSDPRPTHGEIRQFYRDEYRRDYKKTVIPKDKHILRAGRVGLKRLGNLRRYVSPGGRILDAGSGGGEFVYICQRAGYNAMGIEPNKGYARFSTHEYGVDVFNGFYQDAEYDSLFDCITLFHVLEHLDEPVRSLTFLSQFLREGGHFIIEVPNVDFTGTAPNQKWHVGHLYNFNEQTLVATAALAGLKKVSIDHTDDGGVLLATFEKPATPYSPNIHQMLEGSFKRTYRVLLDHSRVKHYIKIHTPLKRLVTKIHREFNEHKTVRRCVGDRPVDILDELIDRNSA